MFPGLGFRVGANLVAPAFRQAVSGNLKDGGGPVALTLNGVLANSVLVLGSSLYEGSGDGLPNTVTSSPSLTFTNRSATIDLNGGADAQGMAASIWTSGATAAGNHTVTVAVAGFSSASMTLIEVTGLTPASVLDVAANANGSSSTATSGSATATTSNGFAVACLVVNGITPTISIPAGWSLAGENESGAVGVPHSFVYRTVSATGAVSASWAMNASGQFGGCVAVLK